jgi:hypothetical protein
MAVPSNKGFQNAQRRFTGTPKLTPKPNAAHASRSSNPVDGTPVEQPKCTAISHPGPDGLSADPALSDLANKMFPPYRATPPTDTKSPSGFRSACGRGCYLLPTCPIKSDVIGFKIVKKSIFRIKAV